MADLNSWEDDKDAQQDDLSQRTQQMNLRGSAPNSFTPGAGSFVPGANSFQPGAASFQSYNQFPQYGGGGYQNNAYPQYGGQQGYQQQQQYNGYGQQGYGQQGYGGYQNQYQQYGGQQQQSFNQYQQQQAPQQSQQRTQQPPVQIAKRPAAGTPAAPAASSGPAPVKTLDTGAPKTAKVLSIGDTGAPKVEKSTGGAKVLSLGTPAAPVAKTPAPAKDNADKSKPEAGAKVAAAKAVEKTDSAKGSPAPTGKSSPAPADMDKSANKKADAVIEEQTADVDESVLNEIYGKEHVNVIFLGHVDAGKSTLGGSLLYATGMVDQRTLDKYKREAKEAGRETWFLSWALDLTKEERDKGKTVEVGRGFFETEKRRYSILDAPGHKTYVPNMIGGASQADVGVLVISARKGEYETGFEKGGQTQEHAMLAKTQGVNKLLVVVNKMDDPTAAWSEERYKECTVKLTAFLKKTGYNPKTDLTFMPVSAQTGVGIKDRVPKDICPWYNEGPSLLDFLDNMPTLDRKLNAPFMMPISAKYKDMGTMIEGKIEAGVIKKDMTYLMMPNREKIGISALYGEGEEEIPIGQAGDQVRMRLRGIEEEDILPGFVLCSPKRPVHNVTAFEAQIHLLPELKSILSAGYNCVMHVHTATEEVTFAALLHKLEKGTGRKSKKPPGFATKGMAIIARLEVTGGAGSICVERFEDYPQMGRFTLRDSGLTIAIGKITKLITEEDGTAAA